MNKKRQKKLQAKSRLEWLMRDKRPVPPCFDCDAVTFNKHEHASCTLSGLKSVDCNPMNAWLESIGEKIILNEKKA